MNKVNYTVEKPIENIHFYVQKNIIILLPLTWEEENPT